MQAESARRLLIWTFFRNIVDDDIMMTLIKCSKYAKFDFIISRVFGYNRDKYA